MTNHGACRAAGMTATVCQKGDFRYGSDSDLPKRPEPSRSPSESYHLKRCALPTLANSGPPSRICFQTAAALSNAAITWRKRSSRGARVSGCVKMYKSLSWIARMTRLATSLGSIPPRMRVASCAVAGSGVSSTGVPKWSARNRWMFSA
jgi:hypothetical protein